ncbi:MAG: HAD-IIIC family phosphatase [Gemmatimonadales bacterium]|nr:MAG: HAD-IIIC family phosphatase [Gemmatimonadales bacterium]
MSRPLRGLLVSDFHTGNLANLLARDAGEPRVETESAPFGQVTPVLLQGEGAGEGEAGLDFALVWTRPEAVIQGFGHALAMEGPSVEEILSEVDAFVAQLRTFAGRVGTVFVATWSRNPRDRGLGILDLSHPEGPGRVLHQMNARLMEGLAGVPGIYLLDSDRWLAEGGKDAADPRLWYLAKIPYAPVVLRAAVRELKAGLRAVQGRGRKLLIVDLDDTLWGGIVGETGWEGLRLGGHDAKGEAYLDFQRALKALTRRGVILGIVSKNDPEVALTAIREHPEMILRTEDFAGWRINWQDKAQNVAELVAELNLGLDAAVFIDDNPAERGRVREALPEVAVPEWPEDPLRYATELRSLDLFDQAQLSPEDRTRSRSYAAERERKDLFAGTGSMEEWLARLELEVRARPLDGSTLPRAVQLLNKTNQMNLRTRRLSEGEFLAWSRDASRRVWTFRVQDRFSDTGLTGLLCISLVGDEARIEDFILSCRVFGRKVENAMVHVAAEGARELGARSLVAEYLETERNRPCLTFFRERSGLVPEGEGGRVFRWDLGRSYPVPSHLELMLEGIPQAQP